jgi:membrane protein DedA with SNARE-associated domain
MNDLDILLSNLYPWSYLIIGAGVMIENAGIPVPGETIMVAASILSSTGQLDPYMVIFSGATGAIIGDNIGYWAGRIGGRKILDRLSEQFSYVDKSVKITEKFFKKYGGVTVLLARFVTGVRIFAGPFAGVSRMDFKRFFVFNAVGAVLWASVLVFGIMHLGHMYIRYIKDYQYADDIIYGLLFVVLLFIAYKIMKKLRSQ